MVQRLLRKAAFGGVALVLALAGCGSDAFPDYHYKMTIYAGGKAYSSVRGIEQERVSSLADSSGQAVKRRLSGEAVIIDANGQTYYALLTRPDNADYALLTVTAAALGPPISGAPPKTGAEAAVDDYREDQRRARDPGYYLDDAAGESRAMTRIVGPKPLPRTLPARQGRPPQDAWPMFVTFSNPADPRTVREVSAESIGVSNITVEMTDDDVTTGIEEKLPWVLTHIGALVRTKPQESKWDKPPAHRLNRAAFTMESAE